MVNQVLYEFDDFGQIAKSWQEHDGVKDGSTLNVQYAYDYTDSSDLITTSARPLTVTYPSGRVEVKEGETTIAEYQYDGLHRRTVKTVSSTDYHYYLSEQNQILEEQIDTGSPAVNELSGILTTWMPLRSWRLVGLACRQA